jgi:hypothetical protein
MALQSRIGLINLKAQGNNAASYFPAQLMGDPVGT